MPATSLAQPLTMYGDVLREVAVNAAMAVPAIRQRRLARPRNSAAFTGSREEIDRYAFQALCGIERLTGSIAGRTVVEFGPGDHLASGLAMVAAGAARYTALDRFVPNYSSAEAKRWYRGVEGAWASAHPDQPWPEDLSADRFPEGYPERVSTVAEGVEGRKVTHAGNTYDIVTSWQVGEHVSDVQAFADLTARLLAPDGVAVHRVDFGPHDFWLGYDDPLTFLRFGPRLWEAMSSQRGCPNRWCHHEFHAALVASGLSAVCEDVGLFDMDIAEVSKLHRRVRDTPPESLRVRDAVYVCRHAGATP